MSDDDPGRPADTMFFCRLGTGLAIEVVVLILLIVGIVRIYHVHGNLLTSDDADCALKSGFGMFILALAIQGGLAVFDLVVVIAVVMSKATCGRCSCYSIKIIAHFMSFAGTVLGTMIYGIKDPDQIGWGFWVGLIAGFICCFNGMIYYLTQQTRKFLERSGVDMKVLERGGKIE